ncbi:hypothetical protein [Haloterrigena alkaliphila]|uniref:Uncharacterized protein n=1 Tax=Haloterrigena alkaliphila TaxID=2816475 RepID=A0A8A2VJC7_9EURY|nr:hypothetical protein [Haloterrigena alkaliphila]QSX00801.1 hypothetical protein J0X25_07545 [Haloterrigena alkaliphila]
MQENGISRPRRDPFETLVDVLAAVDRDDLLLGIVPIAFAVALVAASTLSVSLPGAMGIAATIGVLVVIDACYRNPPIDQGST